MHCFDVFVACCSVSERFGVQLVLQYSAVDSIVGRYLLALSKFLACNGFQSSEFWCTSLFDVAMCSLNVRPLSCVTPRIFPLLV